MIGRGERITRAYTHGRLLLLLAVVSALFITVGAAVLYGFTH